MIKNLNLLSYYTTYKINNQVLRKIFAGFFIFWAEKQLNQKGMRISHTPDLNADARNRTVLAMTETTAKNYGLL